MKCFVAVVLLSLAVACAQPQAVERPAEAGTSPAAFAPLPFTADEIRAAHPDGTMLKFLMQRAGADDAVQVMKFSGANAEGTTVASAMQTPDGTPLGDAPSARATWTELRDHASFEAAQTEIGEASTKVRAGSYECMVYRVQREGGVVQEFHFAKSKPGPPVLMLVRQAGEEMLRMELVEYQRGSN